jgi:hypothetical protein
VLFLSNKNKNNYSEIDYLFSHKNKNNRIRSPHNCGKYSIILIDIFYSIREIIGRVYKKTGYLCDPHGATAYQAARTFIDKNPEYTGIFLETAHPAKFRESVEEVIGIPIDIPERLAAFADRKKLSQFINPAFDDFKDYLKDQAR